VAFEVDGKKVGEGRVDQTEHMVFSADETCDIGFESGSPVTWIISYLQRNACGLPWQYNKYARYPPPEPGSSRERDEPGYPPVSCCQSHRQAHARCADPDGHDRHYEAQKRPEVAVNQAMARQ
jgi:hypothetical protein